MRFLDIDQPIYNLSMDGLTNDDTDPLHWDSFFNFRINATDEANSRLNYFGTWQIAPESTRSQVISLDLTGNVGTMELTASGYSTAFATFPVAVTFTGITANAPRPLQFSLLRCIAVFLALLAIYALRPQSGLWHRRWLAGNVCDRAAGAVLAAILAAFVVVVPFWEPGNTGLATENYNVAFWDHESKISFVYEQYGALAHSLLNGRLDLMQDPPEELLALDNPYDSTAREAAQVNSLWDHAYYNGRYYRHPKPGLSALHDRDGAAVPAGKFRRGASGGAPLVQPGILSRVSAQRDVHRAGQPALLPVCAPLHL